MLQRPRLHVMGEPSAGEWLWFWTSGFGGPQLSGPPLIGNLVLGIGHSNPNLQIDSCLRLMTSADLWTGLPWIPVPSDPNEFSMQFGLFIPDVSSVLYTDLYAQVFHINTPNAQASSALRLRIGGRLP